MSSNFITDSLMDEPEVAGQLEQVPGGAALLANCQVTSSTVHYGSSAGPYGGIGCAAVTPFQITLLKRGNLCVIFSDKRPFGWTSDQGVAATIVDTYHRPEQLSLTRFSR